MAEELDQRSELLSWMATHLPVFAPDSLGRVQHWLAEHSPIFSIFNGGVVLFSLEGDKAMASYRQAGVSQSLQQIDPAWLENMPETGAVHTSPHLGSADEHPQVVTLSQVADSDGQPVAILAGISHILQDGFLDGVIKARIGEQGGVLLISQKDELFVASSRVDMVLKPTPPRGVNLLHDKVMDGYRGSGITLNAEGREELSSISSVPGQPWFVVVRRPTSEVFAVADQLKDQIMRYGYLAALFVIIVVAGVVSYLLWPLVRASAEMRKMISGSRELATLPIERDDEVGALLTGFNELLLKMQRQQDDLKGTLLEKDRFFASMSHELRTPLTCVIGHVDLLKATPLTESQQELVRSASLSSRRLLSLINDILDMSKIEANKFQVDSAPYDLTELLNEIRTMFEYYAGNSKLQFVVEQQFKPRFQLQGDGKRVGQILINLLSNAIKFTSVGSVELRCWRDEERLCFEVRDTGIGMSEEMMSRLFKPFEQADQSISSRYGGTGLGLNISLALTELMGGVITVESEESKGSRFLVRIPYLESEKPVQEDLPQEVLADSAESPLAGKVLIAEDTPELRKLETVMVESLGPSVVAASNGQEALEKALADRYDLVLMDMQMPVMGGVEATKMLRQAGYTAPIVALTGNVTTTDQHRFEQAGADGFLHKPIEPDVLRATLSKFLNRRPAAAVSVNNRQGGAEKNVNQGLHKLFVERLEEMLAGLRQGVESGDWEALQNITHNLKGGAPMFGHPELGELGGEVNRLIIERDLDSIGGLLTRLEKAMESVVGSGGN